MVCWGNVLLTAPGGPWCTCVLGELARSSAYMLNGRIRNLARTVVAWLGKRFTGMATNNRPSVLGLLRTPETITAPPVVQQYPVVIGPLPVRLPVPLPPEYPETLPETAEHNRIVRVHSAWMRLVQTYCLFLSRVRFTYSMNSSFRQMLVGEYD